MANCQKGCICANSTFSWWGSFLNQTGSKIYMPKTWFKNDINYYDELYFENVHVVDI